jgi:hypothetical protein
VRSLVLTIGLLSTGGASCIMVVSFSREIMAFLTGMDNIIVTAGG